MSASSPGSLCLLTAVLLTASAPSFALDVEVGRATVQLSEPGWKVLPMEDAGAAYSGEVEGTLPSQSRILLKLAGDQSLQAVLVLRASGAAMSKGYMAYSAPCASSEHWYAKGSEGFNLPYRECTFVGKSWPARAIMKGIGAKALDTLDAAGQPLPAAWTPIVANYSSSNGSFVDLQAYLTPEFAGPAGAAPSDLPKGISAKFVALGSELMAAVRSSVRSMSGKLVVPALPFDPPPTPDKKVALAAAIP